jgi:adenine-specific DNA methylase
MSIEDRFDVSLIAGMALREKQIQQRYRPIIAVHKWFARRPGTLFRGLLLAELGDRPLAELFFRANDFPGRTIADPFMGGGTPLIEANRVGCDVIGLDLNPMAAWIVREEIEHIDLEAYRAAASRLVAELGRAVGPFYRTDCPATGDLDVPAKYFVWVKTVRCEHCGHGVDLFPGYLLAGDARHPRPVLVCPGCGQLNEVDDRKSPANRCRDCGSELREVGPARRGRCACARCGRDALYPRPDAGPPGHRMIAIEYVNPPRRADHQGRFFKRPDAKDLALYEAAAERWRAISPAARYVPDDLIPPGDETGRLRRWGYRRYRELFNERQLLGLELSCALVAAEGDGRLRRALATNLSDLLRYQNMLCRYDTMALKSLDVFSVHGFPAGLVQCESNLPGIVDEAGASVGSGGWSNIVEKYSRAKRYCLLPFETRVEGRRRVQVPIPGEWIGERREGASPRSVSIRCESSTSVELPAGSIDAVLTDPPYFGNVQYGELMDFCYVWLRRLAGDGAEGRLGGRESTRSAEELTGNATEARGIERFADGLSSVWRAMARALKPDAPLAFTFHHNAVEVYHAVGVAILDAGLRCTATLPCPAEMGGSIHIHGTASSIVDTVFVCRARKRSRGVQRAASLDDVAALVRDELAKLRDADVRPTLGDVRCIVLGHLTRLATWRCRAGWDRTLPAAVRLERFAAAMESIGDPGPVIEALAAEARVPRPPSAPATAHETLPLFPDLVPRIDAINGPSRK